MARDRSESEAREKKEKRDKKRKLDGADDSAKKEKKEKKRKSTVDPEGLENAVEGEQPASVEVDDMEVDIKEEEEGKTDADKVPLVALVPFANPLCDDKAQKKVLKSVKKAAKHRAIKRGVKECVKAIRKSPTATPGAQSTTGVVVLAADISPMDVISHIPVLCEDHGIPYLYVPSRAELGAAGNTKRPTSVVMMTPKVGAGGSARKEDEPANEAEWQEAYADVHKLAVKLGRQVKV